MKSSDVHAKSELNFYLEEHIVPRTPNFDVLSWWNVNAVKFLTLPKIAEDILAIPVSTVASKSSFSTSGMLITPHCSRLHPTTLEALMCAQSWLWSEMNGTSSTPDSPYPPKFCDDEEDPDEHLEERKMELRQAIIKWNKVAVQTVFLRDTTKPGIEKCLEET